MTTILRIHDEAHKGYSQNLLMKDIARLIGVRRATLANWAMEFSMFIPSVKQGRKEYFRPEATEVLRHIRDLKAEGYNKTQILESLTKEFPIDMDKVRNRVTKAYNVKDKEGHDVVYRAIQSLGEVNERLDNLIQQVGNANPENKRLREFLETQGQTIDSRSISQSETQRDGFVIQRQSVEERNRDLLKQLRIKIEEKEKLTKKQGFFARLLNR